MGSIYKSTSHFYFYLVIKKRIKKHRLTHSEELYYDIDLGQVFVSPGVYTIEHDITILRTGDINAFEVTGDIRVNNGRLHAIGTVIWNQELHRLEFWDGNVWQHLITNNIV